MYRRNSGNTGVTTDIEIWNSGAFHIQSLKNNGSSLEYVYQVHKNVVEFCNFFKKVRFFFILGIFLFVYDFNICKFACTVSRDPCLQDMYTLLKPLGCPSISSSQCHGREFLLLYKLSLYVRKRKFHNMIWILF